MLRPAWGPMLANTPLDGGAAAVVTVNDWSTAPAQADATWNDAARSSSAKRLLMESLPEMSGANSYLTTKKSQTLCLSSIRSRSFKETKISFWWCRQQESNPRPTDYKSVALPTELCRHAWRGGIFAQSCGGWSRGWRCVLFAPSPQPLSREGRGARSERQSWARSKRGDDRARSLARSSSDQKQVVGSSRRSRWATCVRQSNGCCGSLAKSSQ